MPARRFFVEATHAVGARVEIGARDARKILRVLRLSAGDAVEIVDAAGHVFAARVEPHGAQLHATLLAELAETRRTAIRVEVAQGVPKGSRMDFVVEKTTELGAAAIRPFYCERSVVRDPGAEKLERWRRLARGAAQQSGRNDVPPVEPPEPFAALLARFGGYDAVLFAWEFAARVPLRERLTELLERARDVLVVVGPEGGFSRGEAEEAERAGARHVWLGPRILRAETAALALLAVIDAFA